MDKLAKLARDKALTYMFCRQQRFDPAKFATRDLAVKGRLGSIYHAESKWMRTRWIPWRGGFGVNDTRGGGVLLDLGIHRLVHHGLPAPGRCERGDALCFFPPRQRAQGSDPAL